MKEKLHSFWKMQVRVEETNAIRVDGAQKMTILCGKRGMKRNSTRVACITVWMLVPITMEN